MDFYELQIPFIQVPLIKDTCYTKQWFILNAHHCDNDLKSLLIWEKLCSYPKYLQLAFFKKTKKHYNVQVETKKKCQIIHETFEIKKNQMGMVYSQLHLANSV